MPSEATTKKTMITEEQVRAEIFSQDQRLFEVFDFALNVIGFDEDTLEAAAQRVSGRVSEDSDLYDEDALAHSAIMEFYDNIQNSDNPSRYVTKFLNLDPDTNRVILQQMVVSVGDAIKRFVERANYVPPEESKYDSVVVMTDSGLKGMMPVLEELVRHYEARTTSKA